MTWWQGRMVGFDLETTGPLPEAARIVTAAVVAVGGGAETDITTMLADPGVPIPEEAAAVHGVTTEMAQAEGRPAAEVVTEIRDLLEQMLDPAVPLVIKNARYDVTVLDRECRRHGVKPLDLRYVRVVDLQVIDPFLDRYRRSYPQGVTREQAKEQGIPSTRTLEGLCAVYDAVLDGAHDAAYDALAACRLAYRMGQRGEVKRRVRGRSDAIELAGLKREWEEVRHDLGRLHDAQRRWALAERVRFAEYKDSIGEHDEAERIRAEIGWPLLEPMPWEGMEPVESEPLA